MNMTSTSFDIDKFLAFLKTKLPELDSVTKEILRAALANARNETDFRFIRDWLRDPVKWLMPKVSLDTFLDDKHYL